MLEVIILTRMRMYNAELVAKNAQLSGFNFGLSLGRPHFFVCALYWATNTDGKW